MRTFFSHCIPDVDHIFFLEKRDSKHLFRTLRAREGDQLELINGAGVSAVAVVQADESLKILSRTQATEPVRKIHLAVAVPRRQKMDQLMTQCTELGVWSLTPLISARSVAIIDKEPDDERWINLLVEACKQSQNPFIPKLEKVQTLSAFLAMHNWQKEVGFMGQPQGVVSEIKPIEKVCDLWWIVGPEGGFTQEEEEQMIAAGIRPLCLAPYVLRVETAAVVGCATLLNM